MLLKYLKQRAWIKLLRVLKGHRQLKKSNSLERIFALKQDLASTPCIKNRSYAKFIFGSEVEQPELIIRQYLLARMESVNFSKSLLHSIGNSNSPISYPLPYEWRKVLIDNGFRISNFFSVLKWHGFVFIKFILGIKLFTIQLFNIFCNISLNDNFKKGRHVFFMNLSLRNFPLIMSSGPMENIFTWYIQWSGKITNFETLCHDVKGIEKEYLNNIPVISSFSELPSIKKFTDLIFLFFWGSAIILFSVMEMIRGNWCYALLFGESFKAKLFRIAEHKELAKDYLFHNSNWIYRPLWTYVAENRGSRILFYFYSTNIEGFKQPQGYPPAYIGWKISTWTNQLVWDTYQQDFINRSVEKKINSHIVGPIWFESGVEKIVSIPSNSIAVFDVQPVRDAFYNTLGIPFDYFIPEHCNKFLSDIHEILSLNGNTLILKRKRNIGKLIHYKYQNLIKQLEKESTFIMLDPEIRAQQIIENCIAVISMPFTATALIAKQMDKPSVYYDPSGLIYKDDNGAHGILIINDKKDLEKWLETVTKNHKS